MKIIHCTNNQPNRTPEDEARKESAIQSWKMLTPPMVSARYCHYVRDSRILGDKVPKPFFRDILGFGMQTAQSGDALLFTNNDIIIHPLALGVIEEALQKWGAVSAHREALNTHPDLKSKSLFVSVIPDHPGRDAAVFKVEWLWDHWNEIPDWVVGACQLDQGFAALIRCKTGCPEINTAPNGQSYDRELPRGYFGHIEHPSPWCCHPEPSNDYNTTLTIKLMEKLYGKPGNKYRYL